MRGYPDLLERLNTALEAGAILAFVDVPAGDIDYFTDNLALNLPNYLPADAASDDKLETADFYAVAARLDSEDESIENDYAYFGIDLTSSDKDFTVTVWSGDEEISFDIDEYTEDTDTEYIYVDENGNILSEDPNPMNYDYVTDCANDFLEWVKDMNSLKALSEANTESSVSATAENTATIFPGVSATFTPTLHVEPRNYYFTADSEKIFVTHKAWHRDTSINFSILPVHSFSDGYDYYVFKVTGNTDTSKQYAHLSYMGYFAQRNRVIEGMTKDKDGSLVCDNILGYNWYCQYTAQLMSGKTPVGSVLVSAPDTNNTQRRSTRASNSLLTEGLRAVCRRRTASKGTSR